jgi:hypothetical protein
MFTRSVDPSSSSGEHLELPVEEQLSRAKPWSPSSQPVLDDLSDEEEAEFLRVISR